MFELNVRSRLFPARVILVKDVFFISIMPHHSMRSPDFRMTNLGKLFTALNISSTNDQAISDMARNHAMRMVMLSIIRRREWRGRDQATSKAAPADIMFATQSLSYQHDFPARSQIIAPQKDQRMCRRRGGRIFVIGSLISPQSTFAKGSREIANGLNP